MNRIPTREGHRRGVPGTARRAAAIAALALGAAIVTAGCWGAGLAPPPPTSPTPGASITPVIEQTRLQLEGALRAGGLALARPDVAYRPAEAPALAAAPRVAFQAVLDGDPSQGWIVVYELRDPQAAYEAGREAAAYLGTGPGRVQFAPDTRFVLRQVGATVVFTAWSAAGASDPTAGQRLLVLLQTVGAGIPIAGG